MRAPPRRQWLVSALSVPLAVAVIVPARAAAPPAADLLEFLGSVDSEDGQWSEYLGSTDLEQAAKPTAPKTPAKPVNPGSASSAKPPSTPSAPPAAPKAPSAKAGA